MDDADLRTPADPPTAPATLADFAVRRSFQRHRWLVLLQGIGSGVLGASIPLIILWMVAEGNFGAVCLAVVLLALVLLMAGALFAFSFIASFIISILDRGGNPWMRLLGFAPLVLATGAVIVYRFLVPQTVELDENQSIILLAGSVLAGVTLIDLHLALLVPRGHGGARWGCVAAALIPLLTLALAAVLMTDNATNTRVLVAFALPFFGVAAAALVLFVVTGRVLAKYPVADERPPRETERRDS